MGFAIIISEKGGAERREVFDRDEIHVGRVQGNDLMLPKGNVSKRHARLMFRDGRFIVADLKSTNGTYVNGRKIAAATIVREGDKIYVGDFVLRFEATPGTVLAADSMVNAPGPREATPGELGGPPSSSPAPLVGDGSQSAAVMPAALPVGESVAPPRQTSSQSSAPVAIPRPPTAMRGGTAMVPAQPPTPDIHATSAQAPPVIAVPPAAPAAPSSVATPLPATPASVPAPQTPQSEVRPSVTEAPRAAREPSHTAHRLALASLIERIAEVIDLSPIDAGASVDEAFSSKVDKTIREQLTALRQEGDIPGGVDHEAIIRDAQRELLALGPIGPLLDDEDVSEIQVLRYDDIRVVRGRQQIVIEPPFTSEESLRRVIARLCAQSGVPLQAGEAIVDRRLARTTGHMMAVLSPVALRGPVLVVRKRRRADASVEDLVRNNTMSRSMASILTLAHSARSNILVVGAPGTAAPSLISALTSLSSNEDRVVALQDPEEPLVSSNHATLLHLSDLGEHGAQLLAAAAKLPADRFVVGGLAGPTGAALLGSVAEGLRGVMTLVRAPTLRHAFARLVPEIAAAMPGVSLEVIREWIVGAFELAIEVTRLRDGRHRVLRVSEIFGVEGGAIMLRDIATFSAERNGTSASVEGAFRTHGVVPRFVDDLQARGVPVDYSLFERS